VGHPQLGWSEGWATRPADSTRWNYNAIALSTGTSATDAFNLYVRRFANAELGLNPVANIDNPGVLPITQVGQKIRFRLAVGWKSFFSGPFTVKVKEFDPAGLRFSIVTMSDHPLAGWRYWRAVQAQPGELVVETGAVDAPFSPSALLVDPWLRLDQTDMWKSYLQYIQSAMGSTRANDPSYGDDELDGIWDLDNQNPVKREQILTNICGLGPEGFCRP
jgi:hypothetical protein